MSRSLINRLIFLGAIVILAIVFTQTYILMKTWDIKDQEFDLSVRIMLRKTAERLASFEGIDLPKTGLITRTSSNYYAVNINSNIDANVLEDYLLQEMGNHSIKTDFEYAVYDCHSKELLYGNYCKLTVGNEVVTSQELPTFEDLDYYFVVSFPTRNSFLLSNMRIAIIFSLISILAVSFFIYSIYIIIRQKRVSELQKDFINNMTHEFKTPISSIKIASEVLANQDAIKTDPRLQRYAEIIKDQNTRLNNQVEKVLNLAKLEKNGFTLKKERIDAKKMIENIVRSENLKLTDQPIQFESNAESAMISADPLHFSNVVHNILDNAVKYSNDNIAIKVSLEQNNGNHIIKFKDNGIGISKNDIENIFDKFYRVSTGDKHDVKGFGLGLYYVKSICDSHGWNITVQSDKGKGTTFSIKIPNDHE